MARPDRLMKALRRITGCLVRMKEWEILAEVPILADAPAPEDSVEKRVLFT